MRGVKRDREGQTTLWRARRWGCDMQSEMMSRTKGDGALDSFHKIWRIESLKSWRMSHATRLYPPFTTLHGDQLHFHFHFHSHFHFRFHVANANHVQGQDLNIDVKMPAATPEIEVLKPKDPSLEDNNDWPDFQLTDVEITNPRTGELSNLLVANEGNALVVSGKLAKSKSRINYC